MWVDAGIIPTLFSAQHVRIWMSGLNLDDGGNCDTRSCDGIQITVRFLRCEAVAELAVIVVIVLVQY